MARRRNPVRQWVVTTACLAFAKVTAWLPLGISRWLGRWCGTLAYCLVPRIRKVGLANLDLAYGDTLTRDAKARVLRRATQNVGIVAAEFSHILKLTGAYLTKHVTLKGIDHIDTTRGVLLIGAHLGNWEWMSAPLQAYGCRTVGIVRPLDDARLNAFVDRVRRSWGGLTIDKRDAGPEVIRLLREGFIVGAMVDQSPRENGVPVTFFGRQCWATVFPVMAAVRARVPVHTVAMVRSPDGSYTLELSPPIPVTRSGDLRKDLLENTQRCQDAIEELVRRYPEQWLWLHRRWKPRPRLEREWQARTRRDKQKNEG